MTEPITHHPSGVNRRNLPKALARSLPVAAFAVSPSEMK